MKYTLLEDIGDEDAFSTTKKPLIGRQIEILRSREHIQNGWNKGLMYCKIMNDSFFPYIFIHYKIRFLKSKSEFIAYQL